MPFHTFIQSPLNDFQDQTFYGVKLVDDLGLPLEYKPMLSFDMSCDEYIEIFNKLMSARSYAFNWVGKKTLKSFKNSCIFKGCDTLSTLGIFKPK